MTDPERGNPTSSDVGGCQKAVAVLDLEEAITHEELLEMDREELPDAAKDFFNDDKSEEDDSE